MRYVFVILAAWLVATDAVSQAPDDDASFEASVCAVEATVENREEKHFDASLAAVRGSLAQLKYDTFRAVKAQKQELTAGNKARLPLDSKYILTLEVRGQDTLGRVLLTARLDMKVKTPEGREVLRKALETNTAVVPGKNLILVGPERKDGDLVVVISLRAKQQEARPSTREHQGWLPRAAFR